MKNNITIYGYPVSPCDGETSRLKIGVTTNPDKRFNDVLGYNPDLDLNSIHRRDIIEDNSIFQKTKTITNLVNKVDGKTLQPDEFIHKMLRNKGYKSPDKGNYKYKHKNSEVFIDVDWKVVDECITTAINNDWNWIKVRKVLNQNKPSLQLHLWQAWNIARHADTRLMLPDEDTIAEFSCPRFGKTIKELYDFYKSDANLLILAQYNLSPVTSFINELNSWVEFADIEMYDFTDSAIDISGLPTDLTHGKKVIAISLCGEKDRDKNVEFCEYLKQYGDASKTIIKMDEVDFGSATEKSKYKLDKIKNALKGVKVDYFSGTGEDKVNFKMELSDKVKASAIRISYVELLFIKNGTHYLFTPEYRNTLDPARNKNEIEFLNNIPKTNYRKPEGLVNPIFCSFSVGPDILQCIGDVYREKGDDDPKLGFSFIKINKMPYKYAPVHQNIWKQFLGIGKLKGCRIDYMNITKGKQLRVIMCWVSAGSGMTKKHLRELAEVLNNDSELSSQWNFIPVCGQVGKDSNGKDIKWGAFSKGGTPATNNREAESFANREIDRAKKDGKGVIFLAMTLAQRSFSVSRIDATVFYRDDLPADSAEQKLSRVLTPGLDYWGQPKKCGYIFDLSLTPNTSRLLNNYIYSEINEQAKSGTPAKIAATRFYEVIDVFEMNQLGLIEKKDSFSDVDFSSFVKVSRSIYARSELRDMVINIGNMDDFIEFIKAVSPKMSKTKKQTDILKDFVDNAATSNGKSIKKHDFDFDDNDDVKNEDENSSSTFTQAIVLARRFLYESVLNMAAIYCSIVGMDLGDIEKNKINYSNILYTIKTNTQAFNLFKEHFKFSSDEQAKKIIEYISKTPIMDKLTSNLYNVISEISFGKDLGEDDINNYFFADHTDGKIHTPMKLVSEMMSKWKEYCQANYGNIRFLDPHCKTGTFLRWIHQMLLDGGISEDVIQKQVEGLEDDEVYVVIARHISGIRNICYKNLITSNDYEIVIDSMKFDVIVGNPPYQTKSDASNTKTQPIWDKFVTKAFSLLKDGGYLCLVHPSGWRSNGDIYEDGKILKSKQINYLEIHSESDGMKTFGATTRYDWYVAQNCESTKETTIKDQSGVITNMNITKSLFIPNSQLDLINSMIAEDNEEKVEILYSRSAYGSDKKNMSQEKKGEFKYPVVYSTPIDSPTIWYSSTNQNGHFGVSKLILNPCRPIGFVIDYEGKYGMSQFCVGIVGDNAYIDMVADVIKNQKINGFTEFMESCHFTDKVFNKDVISLFRKDFWKHFVNENGIN